MPVCCVNTTKPILNPKISSYTKNACCGDKTVLNPGYALYNSLFKFRQYVGLQMKYEVYAFKTFDLAFFTLNFIPFTYSSNHAKLKYHFYL